MTLLALRAVEVAYGDLPALTAVDLVIEAGEILSVVGANGAGKTTMLRAISGLLRPRAGEILLDGVRLDRLPSHAVVERGVVQVPEGRKIFPSLTVLENLELGSYVRAARAHRRESLERVLALFPILAERRGQAAGNMSGGQQQMLAIGRALMSAPKLLLVDEPSVGLAPILVSHTITTIKQLKERTSLTVLMAEQNFNQAIRIANRGYIIVHGEIVVAAGSVDELKGNDIVKRLYLGGVA